MNDRTDRTRQLRRVAFVVNTDRGFLTHRADWARKLAEKGARVRVYAPDTGYADHIRSLGFEFRETNLGRESIDFRVAATAATKLFVEFLAFRPQWVFLVQTAAYVLGWPAAVILRKSTFVRVAGGAGRALALSSGRRPSRLLQMSLRFGARQRNILTLFQITGDMKRFVASGYANLERSFVVGGTGVDTDRWKPGKPETEPRIVLFLSRLYEEKGVREFVKISQELLDTGARFVIVGEPDLGVRTSIDVAELEGWVQSGYVEWLGHRDDVVPVMQTASLLVFPSRHPEGTPRTLIEAAACGLPSVVADQEGCVEVVEDGVTGWAFDPADTLGMARHIRELLANPAILSVAAQHARDRAEREYSTDVVIKRVFDGIMKRTSWHAEGS